MACVVLTWNNVSNEDNYDDLFIDSDNVSFMNGSVDPISTSNYITVCDLEKKFHSKCSF